MFSKENLWQLSPFVVFSSANSLALENAMLSRCVIIRNWFLHENGLFGNFKILFEHSDAKIVFGLRNMIRTFGYPDSG